ncbi:MAG: hypothetical protein K9G40_08110 [Crocinitomicaceae bacterium]|nr:hypothetical protein [Crocinitomicaceae bacterium]MCF8434417.1 hypothetical protein [Crocinitomicaceae bacterium]
MKNTIIILVLSILALACTKKSGVEASITKDCTGTYIRIHDKDYLVCNINSVAEFNEGDKVKVSYKLVKDCPEQEGLMVCMMYHENAGMVRVLKVKKI